MHKDPHSIVLPKATAAPMVMALGIALVITGMVTDPMVSLLGLLLALGGGVKWFMQVLPQEAHEEVAIEIGEAMAASSRTALETQAHPAGTQRRKILPVETFQVTTGIKGGIAGGIAMTVPAALFGILKHHSIWYAANLLAAGGFLSWAGASNAFLSKFHFEGLLAALVIHSLTSLLVGLLYGAMLPMFPKYPILTAGFIAPLLITGILYSALSIVSPILNQRIDWFWFIVSQFAFGLVCGFVVNLSAKVRTPQFQALPFSVRAGIHSDGRTE